MVKITVLTQSLLILGSICATLSEESPGESESTVCDNGVVNIEMDLLSVDPECTNEERIVLVEYLKPAGTSQCSDKDELTNGRQICMNEAITYNTTSIPTSGYYRPLPPKYGEYTYLPPQRWLHALKFGAISFLYHPCAPVDQVMELKRLARSCLWKHIITPSDQLTRDKPFAVVSWGCVLYMDWVDWDEAVEWITDHSLQTPESVFTGDGQYDHGLIEASYVVSTPEDSVICPASHETKDKESSPETPQHTPLPPSISSIPSSNITSTNNGGADTSTGTGAGTEADTTGTETDMTGTGANTNSNVETDSSNDSDHSSNNCTVVNGDTFFCTHHSYVTVVLHNYPFMYALIVLVVLILLVLGLFVVCVFVSKHTSFGSRKKKQMGRYKPCGQFYIGGNNNNLTTGIAIPELGLPKTVLSEREKLLIESDEDDL